MQAATKLVTVVNADGLVLGRMASSVAKQLLRGEEMVIVNAEKSVISGRIGNKVTEAKEFLEVGGVGRGPYHYRRPDRIVRKTVRGMLPFRQPKGKKAYKRLRVYIGIPDEFKNQRMSTVGQAEAKKLTCPYFTVAELAKRIGWNQGE
jgi:large subunit ribosomal protein L13